MRDITLGQYYPSNSVVHRLDPRTKLLLTIAYITVIFFVDTFTGYGIIALFLLFMIFMSKVPLKSVLKSVKAIMYLIAFTTLLNIFFSDAKDNLLFGWWIFEFYQGALINAAKMMIRLLLLIIGPTLLTLTTTPVNLTDGMERLLKPLNYINFPVHEFAIIMSISLRLIPTLIEETDKIMLAQKARCADFDSRNLIKKAKSLLPILIPLFVNSFRRADELAYAMDSRCYHGSKGRTKMKILKYGAADLCAALFFVALFLVILILKYNWFGFEFIGLLF